MKKNRSIYSDNIPVYDYLSGCLKCLGFDICCALLVFSPLMRWHMRISFRRATGLPVQAIKKIFRVCREERAYIQALSPLQLRTCPV